MARRAPPNNEATTSPAVLEADVSFAFYADNSDAIMRCKRAQSTMSSGFYSVGVGAPRTAPGYVATALTPSLRFLEHLSMEISVLPGYSNSRTKKQFPMTVHHSRTKASWRHCHSYEDYRQLQLRLMELMEQGHFCMAECPWLSTFLRKSFPKPPPLFPFGNEKMGEEKRFALMRTIATLQSVLLNPDNHSCEVLTNGVATELVAFLYGETVEQVNSKQAAAPSPVVSRPWEVTSPVGVAVRGFSASIGGLSDDEEDTGDSSQETTRPSSGDDSEEPPFCCAVCALQGHHEDRQVLATWKLPRKQSLRTRTSTTDTMVLSQFAGTPTGSYPFSPGTPPSSPPPLLPENAILSPPRHYYPKELTSTKRFSLGASMSLFHSLRQRVRSPGGPSPFAA